MFLFNKPVVNNYRLSNKSLEIARQSLRSNQMNKGWDKPHMKPQQLPSPPHSKPPVRKVLQTQDIHGAVPKILIRRAGKQYQNLDYSDVAVNRTKEEADRLTRSNRHSSQPPNEWRKSIGPQSESVSPINGYAQVHPYSKQLSPHYKQTNLHETISHSDMPTTMMHQYGQQMPKQERNFSLPKLSYQPRHGSQMQLHTQKQLNDNSATPLPVQMRSDRIRIGPGNHIPQPAGANTRQIVVESSHRNKGKKSSANYDIRDIAPEQMKSFDQRLFPKEKANFKPMLQKNDYMVEQVPQVPRPGQLPTYRGQREGSPGFTDSEADKAGFGTGQLMSIMKAANKGRSHIERFMPPKGKGPNKSPVTNLHRRQDSPISNPLQSRSPDAFRSKTNQNQSSLDVSRFSNNYNQMHGVPPLEHFMQRMPQRRDEPQQPRSLLTDDIQGAQADYSKNQAFTGSYQLDQNKRKTRDPQKREYDYPGMLELTAQLKAYEDQQITSENLRPPLAQQSILPRQSFYQQERLVTEEVQPNNKPKTYSALGVASNQYKDYQGNLVPRVRSGKKFRTPLDSTQSSDAVDYTGKHIPRVNSGKRLKTNIAGAAVNYSQSQLEGFSTFERLGSKQVRRDDLQLMKPIHALKRSHQNLKPSAIAQDKREKAANFRISPDSRAPKGFENDISDEQRSHLVALEGGSISALLEAKANSRKHGRSSRFSTVLQNDKQGTLKQRAE